MREPHAISGRTCSGLGARYVPQPTQANAIHSGIEPNSLAIGYRDIAKAIIAYHGFSTRIPNFSTMLTGRLGMSVSSTGINHRFQGMDLHFTSAFQSHMPNRNVTLTWGM